MTSPPLHANVQILEWIVGKWVSFEAKGEYPTLKDFTFHETLDIESVGQPLLNFNGSTRNSETDAPMHLERGFFKFEPGTNKVALIISQNFGISVIEEGIVENQTLTLETKCIGRTSFTSKHPFVKKYQRRYWLEEDDRDVLNYELHMETENTPMSKHLFVKYLRQK